MADIAAAVGIKAPSLYAHFKSKQALFDGMVASMREYFWQSYPTLHTATANVEEEARLIGEDPSQLLELSVKAFRFYYRDSIAGTLRRLLSMERYRNGQMDALYRELFLDAPIDNQSELITQLIRQGYMPKDLDPRTAAVEAFAPFLLLMNQYDCQPELEEQAVDELKAHIAQYLSRYLICADGSPI